MNSTIDEQVNETAEYLAWRVVEAYMYYLMDLNGRNVYRYETGDIEVSSTFLMPLLDSYHKVRKSALERFEFYWKLLKRIDFDKPQSSKTIMVAGKIPQLNHRGIEYMNAFLGRFGNMITELEVKNLSDLKNAYKKIDDKRYSRHFH